MEAQRGEVICPGSHSLGMTQLSPVCWTPQPRRNSEMKMSTLALDTEWASQWSRGHCWYTGWRDDPGKSTAVGADGREGRSYGGKFPFKAMRVEIVGSYILESQSPPSLTRDGVSGHEWWVPEEAILQALLWPWYTCHEPGGHSARGLPESQRGGCICSVKSLEPGLWALWVHRLGLSCVSGL